MIKDSKNVAGLIDETELLNLAGDENVSGGSTIPCALIATASVIISASIAQFSQSVCPTSACTKSCNK